MKENHPNADLDGKLYDVFLSHSSSDDSFANWLHQQLMQETVATPVGRRPMTVFNDEHSIRPGQIWCNRMIEGVKRSNCVVCVLSPAFLQSENTAKEIIVALHMGIPVLPVFEGELPPHTFILRELFCVDLSEGEGRPRAMEKLLAAIREHVAAPGRATMRDTPEGSRFGSRTDRLSKAAAARDVLPALGLLVADERIFGCAWHVGTGWLMCGAQTGAAAAASIAAGESLRFVWRHEQTWKPPRIIAIKPERGAGIRHWHLRCHPEAPLPGTISLATLADPAPGRFQAAAGLASHDPNLWNPQSVAATVVRWGQPGAIMLDGRQPAPGTPLWTDRGEIVGCLEGETREYTAAVLRH